MSVHEAEQQFRLRLQAVFRSETASHLYTLHASVDQLSRDPSDGHRDLLEDMFRAAHSLRGAARAVEGMDIELRCASLEAMLGPLLRGESAWQAGVVPALQDAIARLAEVCAIHTSQREAGDV